MSKFLSKEAGRLDPYTPGEQPQDQQYIKLNTNESPFPPSPKVLEALSGAEITRLNLYSDPTCASLTAAIAGRCHVQPEEEEREVTKHETAHNKYNKEYNMYIRSFGIDYFD